MASEVDICNLALVKIGEGTIIALSEDSKAGRLCNLFYNDTRDEILREHPWNFATKRVELAKLLTTPSFEFDAEFQLPSDLLKIIKTDDNLLPYRIEGKKLLINNDSVKIEYIARISDTTQFDSLFVVALWMRMASHLAFNLSDNNSLSVAMEQQSRAKVKQARTMDGQEGTPYPIEADVWLNSRS